MKKTLSLLSKPLLSAVFALSTILLISQPALAKKFKVVTTFTIIQDIAQNVAGDAAVVESITKPGAEIHGYQPTPKDIMKAYDADLILWNGLNLEVWFQRFFENFQNV
ncbi:TPA: metal ABC transporter solute-binding protein, Zn/Mn family, partial [Providencia stuartii]